MAFYARAKSAFAAIGSSFWFVPLLMALAGLTLGNLFVFIDSIDALSGLREQPFYPRFGPDGARAVLTTIAGGMMTMASLVFSLTFVGLTQLSGQLGPRVLAMFMQDWATQTVLGAFVGVFLFALVVLGEVSELDDGFVPDLAVAATIAIATGAFGLVIYFVHHMALSIQADVIVAALGKKFQKAIGRVTGQAEKLDMAKSNAHIADFEGFTGAPVPAAQSGYVRHIAYDSLIETLGEKGLRMHIRLRVDDYIAEGMPLAFVEGPAPDIAALAACFTIGPRRDVLQEATYEARALIDIALRALSSGINDPNTAVAAIDHISGALLPLVRSEGVPRVLFAPDGRPVLMRPELGLAHYLDLIVPALLPAMRADTLATERLIELLILFDRVSRQDDEREAITKWRKVMAREVANHDLPQTMVAWLKDKAAG